MGFFPITFFFKSRMMHNVSVLCGGESRLKGVLSLFHLDVENSWACRVPVKHDPGGCLKNKEGRSSY